MANLISKEEQLWLAIITNELELVNNILGSDHDFDINWCKVDIKNFYGYYILMLVSI